jgi:hypothetical protein
MQLLDMNYVGFARPVSSSNRLHACPRTWEVLIYDGTLKMRPSGAKARRFLAICGTTEVEP